MLGGGPGTMSGLILRIAQCIFAAASGIVMVSAPGYSITTAFCFLLVAMGIQTLWSFILICIDIRALRLKRDLQRRHILLSLLTVGDWAISFLSLAAVSSSSGVVVAFYSDLNFCIAGLQSACSMFRIAVGLAFIAWFLLALSSLVLFYLASSTN